MSSCKVIYISYDGMCDPVGASQVLPYICELAKQGTEYFLISFEKADRFSSGEAAVRAQIADLPVHWHPCSYTKNPPVISTMLDLRKMKKLCGRICHENEIDFIHARSYISALAALKIFRKTHLPFIFDMRGFWADERIDGGIWSLKNPVFKTVYNYFKRKEKILLASSRIIVSLTHAAKDFMQQQWNVAGKKIHVIPCAADFELFKKADEYQIRNFRNKHAIPEAKGKTLLYVGSTGTWYLLKEMSDFYEMFRKKFPRSLFVLCVNESNQATEDIKKRFPGEIAVLERVSRNEMPVALSLADYSIMLIKPAFSKKASSPIKLGESLAVGVPVICNAGVGDLGSVESDGYGVVVNELSANDYAEACNRLAEAAYDADDLRSRSASEYALDHNIKKYEAVYNLIKTDKYQQG